MPAIPGSQIPGSAPTAPSAWQAVSSGQSARAIQVAFALEALQALFLLREVLRQHLDGDFTP